ncbi:uncharacterized protein LOC128261874 [Drosophila gunungcola]|uniref:RAP domain-containing protein n=1 Tax=Drosophila gunungcola TaxID=103775 RepID=A0A9P9YSF8_9MUSC|nr:uncharacterized protein LOC128261874 [Drosophila gunungcola]KAI8042237.1 hypothetical protein M5D96_003539 [Drosophila gunungcola]
MYALLRRFAGVSTNGGPFRSYASFTPKDVMRSTAEETGTLLTRFAKHIALERYRDPEHVLPKTTVRYADFFPITDDRYFQRTVQKTDAAQLPALIIQASSYRSNATVPMFVAALNALDNHAANQLDKMETSTVLETLYSFLFLMPSWLKRTDFYHSAMLRLVKEDFRANKERFVQVCFYLGLQKKQAKSSEDFQQLLEEQLPTHLPALSELDLAVISNAAYKTSTLVTGHARSAYESSLVNATLSVQLTAGNDALLISYVKALRLQRVKDERVCQHLQDICLDPARIALIEPRGLAHIFAFFAEQLWDQKECLAIVIERLMTLLKPGDLRPKDLATFLWASAQLNCELTPQQIRQLELAALRKLDHGEYDYFPDNLVDTCLSLCTLGHYSKDLIDAAEELKAAQRKQRAQPKVDSRINVLRSAVAIEQPTMAKLKTEQAFKEFNPAPAYLLRDRPDLTKYAQELSGDAEVEGVDLVCPIAAINLPCLRVQTMGDQESVYFVELLTAEQTLKFSKNPTSLMRLKKRLLESLGRKVVVLNSAEMVTSAKELHQLLKPKANRREESEVAQGLAN